MTTSAAQQTDRPDIAVIATHNDAFRKLACLGTAQDIAIPGRMHVTRSLMEADDGFMDEAVKATGEFDVFEAENDPDEARRLPLDEIIMVVDAQMPVRAKRIQYFDDRLFAAIHGVQKGELPFPVMGKGGGLDSGVGTGVSGPTTPQPGGRVSVAERDAVTTDQDRS